MVSEPYEVLAWGVVILLGLVSLMLWILSEVLGLKDRMLHLERERAGAEAEERWDEEAKAALTEPCVFCEPGEACEFCEKRGWVWK